MSSFLQDWWTYNWTNLVAMSKVFSRIPQEGFVQPGREITANMIQCTAVTASLVNLFLFLLTRKGRQQVSS